MLTAPTVATLVQVLNAVSSDAVRLLLIKHLGSDFGVPDANALLRILGDASPESMAGLLVELIADGTSVRYDASPKYVFDGRLKDLKGRLRADGFEVIEDALVRLVPGAEPAAQIADALERTLAACDLDSEGDIRHLLRESYENAGATPPDLNGATTKARIALETVARRSAKLIAAKRNKPAPADTWGAALSSLRHEAVISKAEEDALAKVYTLISPGAHVPKGLTDEQWALLSRTFAVSGAYFLVHQHLAA